VGVSELRVSPWKRYGHDRLYVNRAGGEKVAWLDRRTGTLHVFAEEDREAALEALAPYLDQWTSSQARDSSSTPVDGRGQQESTADLSTNKPGAAVRDKLEELAPGWVERALAILLGRRSETYGWRRGLAGERKMGAELERLTSRGWRVLHSVPLPRDVDIDHLLIGPGGVFCVNTKFHKRARVWVGDDSVKIHGQSYPYVRKSRAEARRASGALTRACGFTFDVYPVLAFVGVERLTTVPTLRDVRVVRQREVSAFKGMTGVWTPAEVDAIYVSACRQRTWQNS
jgi:hypothetical protein